MYALLPPIGKMPALPRPKVLGTAQYVGHGTETLAGYSVTGQFSMNLTAAQRSELDRELRSSGFLASRMGDRITYRKEVLSGLARGSQSVTIRDDGTVYGGRSICKLFF